MSDISLDPRTVVVGNSDGSFPGRLGLLLYDDDIAGIVAVTAAQIAGRAPELCADKMVVAQRSESRPSYLQHGVPRKADTMLWTLRIVRQFKLTETQLLSPTGAKISRPSIARNVYRLLGEKVLIQTSERPRIGRLCSTSAQFKMPAPETAEPTVFQDALEISSLDHDPLTVKGDAGAVVTTMTGDVIGTILCGIGGASYAAPLADYLDDQSNLRLLSARHIHDYNKAIDGELLQRATQRSGSIADTSRINYSRLKATIKSGGIEEIRKVAKYVSEKFF